MTNYVEELKTKMQKDGFTIPGKDLTDPMICKEILQAEDEFRKGISVPFVDWYCLDNEQLIEVGKGLQDQLLKAGKEIADLRDQLAGLSGI